MTQMLKTINNVKSKSNVLNEKYRESKVDIRQLILDCIVPNEHGILEFYKDYASIVQKQRVFYLVKEFSQFEQKHIQVTASLSKSFLRVGVALLVLCRFSPFFSPGSHKFNRTTTLRKCQAVSHPENVKSALQLLSQLQIICPFLMDGETFECFFNYFRFGTSYNSIKTRFYAQDDMKKRVLWYDDGYKFNSKHRCGLPDDLRPFLWKLGFNFGKYYSYSSLK